MTAEKGNLGGQPEQRSLIVRQGEIGIQRITEGNVLQAVHFSPQLLERLGRLNDVLGPGSATPVREVSITLFPGRNPIIDTDITPESAYFVQLKASRFGRALIEIAATDKLSGGVRGLLLRDIQELIGSNFQGRMTRLHAFRERSGVESREDFDEDLFLVTNDMTRLFTDFIEEPYIRKGRQVGKKITGTRYPKCEVRLEGIADPLLSLTPKARLERSALTTRDKTTIFHVNRFFYQGSPEDVEKMIEVAIQLFNKDPFYPYHSEDKLPEQKEV